MLKRWVVMKACGCQRLPAYRDDRDGTGIIYEWLERSRSSDSDNDGIGCDSDRTPTATFREPKRRWSLRAARRMRRSGARLQVCEEQPRDGYDRDAFGTGYRSLEDDIIAALPATMRAVG